MPTEAQLAYVAGILDGEGSISLSKSKCNTITHLYRCPHVRIFNTDKRILDAVSSYVGGSERPHKDQYGDHKPCYRLEWNSKPKIAELLTMLLPYLVGKKERAIVMINFCLDNSPNESKEEYWIELKKLNTKGVICCASS